MSGIYIHIPFCKQACHYCDFHFSTSLKNKQALLKAIEDEIIMRCHELEDTKISTIYFGGGTPSLLSRKELDTIIKTIESHYNLEKEIEITLEANPDDLDQTKIKELEDSPINRLSIGVQSFFDQDLRLMNRAHNSKEARQCLELAKERFDNVSIDLIYGIQDLSNERWLKNIEIALSYNFPHISSYALTVEPRTALAKFIDQGKIKDVDDAQSKEQFYILINQLSQQGFIHYEISNFGKPGFFSKNNTAYWTGKQYLGIGPSAHSYIKDQRSWNIANNTKYIKSLTNSILPSESETLTKEDKFNEYIMTGLRTIWGVSFNKISMEFGPGLLEELINNSRPFIDKGLLAIEKPQNSMDDTVLKITDKGKFLVDGIASDLFIINH